MQRWYEIAASMLLASTVVTSNVACDTNSDQRDFAERAFNEDAKGFTRTSVQGVVDSSHIDENDWELAPDYIFGSSVQPAFPNPTSSDEVVLDLQLGLDTQRGNNLTLCIRDPNGGLLPLDSRRSDTGPVFTFFVSPAQISGSGLTRLFVLDTNGQNCGGRLVTYGDALFE